MLPIPLAIAAWARAHHIGLLNWVTLPRWASVSATFLLMDYAYWWWHWADHMIPYPGAFIMSITLISIWM